MQRHCSVASAAANSSNIVVFHTDERENGEHGDQMLVTKINTNWPSSLAFSSSIVAYQRPTFCTDNDFIRILILFIGAVPCAQRENQVGDNDFV